MLRPIVTSFVFAVAAASLAPLVGCSADDVTVGKTDQELQKRGDGGPTGDVQTCSWDDTVSYDVQTGQTTTHAAEGGEYKVGDSFKSPDGCNDCSCTSLGIACTLKECGGGAPGSPPRACSAEAKICPNGSAVGRTGPNCEFALCPATECTDEAKACPDGSSVGRTGPGCTFAPCPASVCTDDAKQCSDGSYVSRTGPTCEFAACP